MIGWIGNDFSLLPLFSFLLRGVILLFIFLQARVFQKRRKQKLEGYECGFSSFGAKHVGFCIQFFNIAILFLLIDLEIALVLPLLGGLFLQGARPSFLIVLLWGLMGALIGLLAMESVGGGLSWREEL